MSRNSLCKGLLLPRNNSDSSLLDSLETIDLAQHREQHRLWKASAQPMHANDANNDSMGSWCGKAGTQAGDQIAHVDFQTTQEHEIYVPSARKSFKMIAEALHNTSDGDEIELVSGVYVEHSTLEVKANDVVLRPAMSGNSPHDGQVEIQLRGLLASLVCRGKGFKASDLELVHSVALHTERVVAPGKNNSEYIPACVNVLSGDVCFE